MMIISQDSRSWPGDEVGHRITHLKPFNLAPHNHIRGRDKKREQARRKNAFDSSLLVVLL